MREFVSSVVNKHLWEANINGHGTLEIGIARLIWEILLLERF